MAGSLSIIPLRSNLLQNHKYLETKDAIIKRLQELHLNDGKFKIDSEMLVLICNMVEHLIQKKDKISKKDLALDILESLFGLTPEEKASISSNIEFIHSNSMIKKHISSYKLFRTGLRELFWSKKK